MPDDAWDRRSDDPDGDAAGSCRPQNCDSYSGLMARAGRSCPRQLRRVPRLQDIAAATKAAATKFDGHRGLAGAPTMMPTIGESVGLRRTLLRYTLAITRDRDWSTKVTIDATTNTVQV